MSFKNTAVIGGSRGLGLCIVKELRSSHQSVFSASRKPAENLQPSIYQAVDLSKPEELPGLLESLQNFQVDRLIYSAGGGPFGTFSEVGWKSHQWAFQVSFLSATWLAHQVQKFDFLKQIIFIGSSVAEAKADPMAASYCASKHALAGLYKTLATEEGAVDFRLYSPGYMDTDLLPKGSWPRMQDKTLWSPENVAKDLLLWSEDQQQIRSHRVLNIWADDAGK